MRSLPKLSRTGVRDFSAPFEEDSLPEEELLLNLPPVAYHEELCINEKLFSSGEPVVVEQERKNPFQVLEQLKSSPK